MGSWRFLVLEILGAKRPVFYLSFFPESGRLDRLELCAEGRCGQPADNLWPSIHYLGLFMFCREYFQPKWNLGVSAFSIGLCNRLCRRAVGARNSGKIHIRSMAGYSRRPCSQCHDHGFRHVPPHCDARIWSHRWLLRCDFWRWINRQLARIRRTEERSPDRGQP